MFRCSCCQTFRSFGLLLWPLERITASPRFFDSKKSWWRLELVAFFHPLPGRVSGRSLQILKAQVRNRFYGSISFSIRPLLYAGKSASVGKDLRSSPGPQEFGEILKPFSVRTRERTGTLPTSFERAKNGLPDTLKQHSHILLIKPTE